MVKVSAVERAELSQATEAMRQWRLQAVKRRKAVPGMRAAVEQLEVVRKVTDPKGMP